MADLSVRQFKKRTKFFRISCSVGLLLIAGLLVFHIITSSNPITKWDVVSQYVFSAMLVITAFLAGVLTSVSSEKALEHSEKQVHLAEKREDANKQAHFWQVYTDSISHLNGNQLWMRIVAIRELKQLAIKNPHFYLAKVLSVLHEFVRFPPTCEGADDPDQATKLEARADIRAANTAIDALSDVSLQSE